MIHRRGLITGLISFVAAPAIVRATSLMPVKKLPAEMISGETWEWRSYGGGFSFAEDTDFLLRVVLSREYENTRRQLAEILYGDCAT